ncbi:MAG TPA: helix-hairpin-helix domain-containing protein [Thermoanaerobaculia bacterium]|nr:helix-hairpin-helix domain-containing protein [Thermoanaerobaculia bacterium]
MQASRIRAGALAALLSVGAAALLFGESAEAPGAAPRVNINTATAAELAYLPRLGSKVAARIVEHRKEKPFARPEDLMEVKGIGEKLFTTLKPYIAVSGPTTLSAKVRSGSSASRRSSPPAAPKEKPANTASVGKGR